MRTEDFRQLILINLYRLDIASKRDDAVQFQTRGRVWKMTKTMHLGFPEIHAVCETPTKIWKAWCYRTCDDPTLLNYRNSDYAIQVY